ncbi:hypothetical protein R6G85_02520 [Actinotignum urinale]|uniref:Helix-turn-helix domain-containing protein n=1 Tax=Actinotignum urinale TaxID=190146 RepID=A0AAW9HRH3_9ACTO|nr:hypothetical protein [Actinotignum urinale]MDY5151362.1 hypothetical protein [Actinotignum urinale]MDY5154303.1 hypothetical protein [Actinotignum urinale]
MNGFDLVRVSDPETSKETAVFVDEHTRRPSERAVLAVLYLHTYPEKGTLTDKQIIHFMHRDGWKFSESRIRTARNALERRGLCQTDGHITNEGGRKERLWKISDAGIDAIEKGIRDDEN